MGLLKHISENPSHVSILQKGGNVPSITTITYTLTFLVHTDMYIIIYNVQTSHNS